MKKYHEKYDHKNGGTVYVFDDIYSKLYEKGFRSNLMACCGEDAGRYREYVKKICGTSKARAFFVEIEKERYDMIEATVGGKDKITAIHGDAFQYDSHPSYPMTTPARIEDFGLGIGIRELIYKAMPRLFYQKSKCHGYHWKAQILDGAIRQVRKDVIVGLYQKYLAVLRLSIASINGCSPFDPKCLSTKNAECMHSYEDASTGHTGSVFRHTVKLKANTRKAELHMYSCLNGSPMLQSLIIYK